MANNPYVPTKYILAHIIAFELAILALMYGLSELQTRHGIQGFIFLLLWGISFNIIINANDPKFMEEN